MKLILTEDYKNAAGRLLPKGSIAEYDLETTRQLIKSGIGIDVSEPQKKTKHKRKTK